MAKRLTEEDIRRIFREEADLRQARQDQLDNLPPDVRRTWERLEGMPVALKPGVNTNPGGNLVRDVDWVLFVQQVIDTYWEVVEEDLNA